MSAEKLDITTYITLRNGEYVNVSELTEEEAKQQLCRAMDFIEKIGEKLSEVDDVIEEWQGT